MVVALLIVVAIIVALAINISSNIKNYRELESEVFKKLNFFSWNVVSYFDEKVIVKSRQALEKYDGIKFFKENKEKLVRAKSIIKRKNEITNILCEFLSNNEYKKHSQYNRLVIQINTVIKNARAYRISVTYISSAGNNLGSKEISLSQYDINKFDRDPSLLMGKGEYNKFLKEQEKEVLNQKQHNYYERVNKLIDYANENRNLLFIKGSVEQLDNLIAKLFYRTVNSIKKIKNINSEEWDIIQAFIAQIEKEIKAVVDRNQKILKYYDSPAFLKIKETCEVLMSTQREFNEYIVDKVESISQLFGTRVIRNKTINEDKYQYIRPYKKTITPFTAEVSAAVFASAENNPLEYVIKNFYPNKNLYPEQIQKLHLLVEELATLKEAKHIIDNYKKEYQQYINDVPDYVMMEDTEGFYSRLGFANIDESMLTVEYTFSYTSGGGMAKREFTVPMTEENIVDLIKALEAKLTISAFTKEQRALMTNKLREFIKKRDNFTCCGCGNSIYTEPNLLLEIDHIIPVSKGGCTIEENLQTLCWKCNRAKSNKMKN
ncbi:MAG: HNH endonuclease [Clostridia bacterium]|nr:HNH endonuclease [Clostridia bacterium]